MSERARKGDGFGPVDREGEGRAASSGRRASASLRICTHFSLHFLQLGFVWFPYVFN